MAERVRRILAATGRGMRGAGQRVGSGVRTAHRHHLGRRLGVALALLIVTLVGVSIGLLIGGRTTQAVGPFAAQFSVSPSFAGGTEVQIPPLGSLQMASHDGPAKLTVRLNSLDEGRTLALANDPRGIAKVSDGAVADVQRGITQLVFQATGAGLLGALVLAGIVFRNMRRVAICGGLALLTFASSGLVALGSFRPGAVEEPRYQGLLANAPAVVGDAKNIADQYGKYRAELQQLVNNVSRLYATFSTLPVYQPAPGTVRVLHISDLHLNPSAWSVIATVVQQYDINVVIDTGDINDWGTEMESSFVDSIGSLKVPYVFIRGNHDSATTAAAVAHERNAIVLENQLTTVDGLTIAGIGDPRFTPDKMEATNGAPAHQINELVEQSGEKLAGTVDAAGKPVNLALVHDPASAGALDGKVPLVLAGHLHHRAVSTMPPLPGKQNTLLMVEGSTGGAGLRGLEGEAPTPLEMSVLYFDPTHTLQAYDAITLGGTGQTQVTIDRHVVHNGQTTPTPASSPP